VEHRISSVKDYTDLVTWKLARELRKSVYDLSRRWPSDEKFVLVAQLRRAAISITANITEGFGRFTYPEHIQFCRQARGSVMEVRDHLTTALDAGYLTKKEWLDLDKLALRVIQVLNGSIRSARAQQQPSRAT